MAAREAHGAKPKSNGNRNASVVSYDKASFESLDGSCASASRTSSPPIQGRAGRRRPRRARGRLAADDAAHGGAGPAGARASVTGGDLIASAAGDPRGAAAGVAIGC